jgi:hypothetical protein
MICAGMTSMCEQRPRDIKELCRQIISSQQQEIDQMKAKLVLLLSIIATNKFVASLKTLACI